MINCISLVPKSFNTEELELNIESPNDGNGPNYIPWAIEGENRCILINVDNNHITKINFSNDSVCPPNCRTVVTEDSKVFLIGGYIGSNFSNEVFEVDISLKKLVKKASMKIPKIGHACCFVKSGKGEQFIFSVGGKSEDG